MHPLLILEVIRLPTLMLRMSPGNFVIQIHFTIVRGSPGELMALICPIYSYAQKALNENIFQKYFQKAPTVKIRRIYNRRRSRLSGCLSTGAIMTSFFGAPFLHAS